MRKNLSKKTLSAFLAIVMTLATMAGMFTFSAGAAQTEDSSAKLTADTSWHTADTAGLEFTLTEPSDFLGFISLISSGKTFEGQTVKLGNDIDLNSGWTAGVCADLATWTANSYGASVVPNNVITYHQGAFAGTFDGQGYTLSGVHYGNATNAGLFGQIADGKTATIKNLIFENSYIGGNDKNTEGGFFGTVKGSAIFSNVYVRNSVYMADNRAYAGFFIGNITSGSNAMACYFSNCIFEGNIVIYANGTAKAEERNAAGFEGGAFVGYIAASSRTVSLVNCIFAGDIVNKTAGYTVTSALFYAATDRVASNTGIVKNCYFIQDNDVLKYGATGQSGSGSVSGTLTAATDESIRGAKATSENSFHEITAASFTGIAAQTLLNSMTYTDTTTSTTYNMNAWVATTTGTPELGADVTASATAAPKGAKISDGATTDFGWYGFQYGTGENSDSLRLLGTVKAEARNKYDSIGFKAVAYFVDASGKAVQTNSVTYTTVYESVAADGTPITEDDAYFFAQTVKGIPQNAGDVIFEITTYAMQGSTEIIGDTYRIVYDCLQHA